MIIINIYIYRERERDIISIIPTNTNIKYQQVGSVSNDTKPNKWFRYNRPGYDHLYAVLRSGG